MCVRVVEILCGVQAEGGQQPNHSGAALLARHPERRRAHVGGVRRAVRRGARVCAGSEQQPADGLVSHAGGGPEGGEAVMLVGGVDVDELSVLGEQRHRLDVPDAARVEERRPRPAAGKSKTVSNTRSCERQAAGRYRLSRPPWHSAMRNGVLVR